MLRPRLLASWSTGSWRRTPYLLGGALIALLIVMTLVAAPYARLLTEQWFRGEVESRSRLVYDSTQASVARALRAGDAERLSSILQGITHDQRILAAALCDDRGRLRMARGVMPQSFSCDRVVQPGTESFSTLHSNGRRLLAGAFPVELSQRTAYLIVLHDISYIDARSNRVQTYVAAGLAGLGVVQLAQYAVQEQVERGELVPLFPDWHHNAVPVFLVYSPNRYVSARMRVFIDWIVETLAKKGLGPT